VVKHFHPKRFICRNKPCPLFGVRAADAGIYDDTETPIPLVFICPGCGTAMGDDQQ
jgi:hypothetical protein